MSRLRTHRRLATWLAALAVLFAAWAPAVSRALGSELDASWVRICSAQGTRWAQVGVDGAPVSLPGGDVIEPCPYCTVHTSDLGVPPGAAVLRALTQPTQVAASARSAAPRAATAWSHAPPRAPPPAC